MRIVLGVVLMVSAWWVISHAFDLSYILPTPEDTISSLLDYLSSFETYKAILSTVVKAALASILVILIGVPLGFIMGLNSFFRDILRPLMMVVQSVPVISWLALVIFTWGIGWKGPVAISVFSLLPTVVFNTMEGVRSTDEELVEMAKVYRVPKLKVLKYIYLGSLIPFISASLNLIVGGVWKVVLVAEFLCGDSGIGVEISWARQFVDVPAVYALTLMGVTLGMISERAVKLITRRMERRWGFC